MDSQGISRSRARPLILLAVLVVMVVTAMVIALRGGSEAEAQSIRNVRITIKCTVAVPSSEAGCRGSWRMTGGFRDSGPVRLISYSRNVGAYLRGTLRSRRGRIRISTETLGVSHTRRGCPASTTFYLGGSDSTGRYDAWRGQTAEGSCSKASFRRGRMSRSDVFRVALRR
jgi:hypothetical protein